MNRAQLGALVCADPANVLMLSGYWPVIGASLVVCDARQKLTLIVPEEEQQLAEEGFADEVHPFAPGSLLEMRTTIQAVRPALQAVVGSLGLDREAIGIEASEAMVPAGYVETYRYRFALSELLRREYPRADVRPADHMLARLRSLKTPREIERLRLACGAARDAFVHGTSRLKEGMNEQQMAAVFREPLAGADVDLNRHRCDGFTYCMSGANAYDAFAAYQRSRSRIVQRGDLALVHCNSYVDGFWTDITRTFVLGQQPDPRQQKMYSAVFQARAAALSVIRPGVSAATVDEAARDVMAAHGFGAEFKHPTGHGVGFCAIDHTARPCIHPASQELLEEGMTFNVEPGIYIRGYGGMRHCDMVAVTSDGYELLTPFQSEVSAMSVDA
jgi:Xaa-Pro dipeptidase